MKKLVLILLMVPLLFKSLSAQETHELYLSDSLNVKSFVHPVVRAEAFYGAPIYDLIDELEDGKWILYNNRKSQKIIIEGSYLNNKRNGLFKYYYTPFKKKRQQELLIEIPYVNGKIDGIVHEYMSVDKISSITNFIDGEKNGFSIGFNSGGRVVQSNYYENDILIRGILYSNEGLRRTFE